MESEVRGKGRGEARSREVLGTGESRKAPSRFLLSLFTKRTWAKVPKKGLCTDPQRKRPRNGGTRTKSEGKSMTSQKSLSHDYSSLLKGQCSGCSLSLVWRGQLSPWGLPGRAFLTICRRAWKVTHRFLHRSWIPHCSNDSNNSINLWLAHYKPGIAPGTLIILTSLVLFTILQMYYYQFTITNEETKKVWKKKRNLLKVVQLANGGISKIIAETSKSSFLW